MNLKLAVLCAAILITPLFAAAQGEFSYNSSGSITGTCGSHESRGYHGLDIGTGCGGNIGAARGGDVRYPGYQSSCGNQVLNYHSNSYRSKTCHTSSYVGGARYVNRNTIIARSGTTGTSSGCHNHLEIAWGGTTQHIPGSGYVSLGTHISWDYPGISN